MTTSHFVYNAELFNLTYFLKKKSKKQNFLGHLVMILIIGTSAQNGDVVDIEVEENVIGAVIGPGGRSIVDLQQFSGARIQVSQKDHFSPGTRNRMVTITGPKQAVATAKYLIEKRIQDEDENRQLQNY